MEAKFDPDLKVWEAARTQYPHPVDKYFGEIFLEILNETPDRVLQIQHEGSETLTCGVLKESSIVIAQNLTKLGIKSDDIIVLMCRNSNFVTSFIHGIVLMGGVIFPLSHHLSFDNLKNLLEQSNPKMIVCDADVLPIIRKTLSDSFNPLIYITSNGEKNSGVLSAFELITKVETEFFHPKFDKPPSDKMLAIICSSGTEGAHKGVIKTHMGCSWIKKIPFTPRAIKLTYSEAFWASGFFLHLYSPFFTNDIRIWTSQSFEINNFIEIVEKYKVTSANLPPIDIAYLLRSEEFLASDHESLKEIFAIGSTISDFIAQNFKKLFPDKTLDTFYGSTEFSVSRTKPNECFKTKAVGSIISPNRLIKIVDEDENRLGPNQVGEIRVKGFSDFDVSVKIFKLNIY